MARAKRVKPPIVTLVVDLNPGYPAPKKKYLKAWLLRQLGVDDPTVTIQDVRPAIKNIRVRSIDAD